MSGTWVPTLSAVETSEEAKAEEASGSSVVEGWTQAEVGNETSGGAQSPAMWLANHTTSWDVPSCSDVRYTTGFLTMFPRVLEAPQSPQRSLRPQSSALQ